MHQLYNLFHPQSIAVIGASDRYGSTGRIVFGQLLAYQPVTHIVPINTNHKSIAGMKAYANLTEMVQEITVDTIIIILSIDKIANIVREAAKLNITNIIVINDLEQTHPQMRSKLERIAQIAQKAHIRFMTISTFGLNNLFIQQPQAVCAYIGQSVSIADCLQHYALERGVHFNRFITLNPQQSDTVSTGQIIDFIASDTNISALLIHINTLDNSRELLSALTAASRNKVVFVLNTLPENPTVSLFNQALERNHIFTIHTLNEFLTATKLLNTNISANGRRIGVISNTPQISMLSLKSLSSMNLTLAQISTNTQRNLVKLLNNKLIATNPLYLSNDSSPNLFQAACNWFLQDEQIDSVYLIYAGTNTLDSNRVAHMVGQLQTLYPRKPLLLVWLGSVDTPKSRLLFNNNKNLYFRQPEHALNALAQLNRYREHRHAHHPISPFYDYRTAAQAAKILREQLISPTSNSNNIKTNSSQFFNALDDALDGLQKHLRPLLPISKTLIEQVFTALNIGFGKKSQDECLITWADQPSFGQVLTLTFQEKTISLLPPLTPLSVNNALEQINLPSLIWQDWLLEATEVLFRLPEIKELQVSVYHDIKRGIMGHDLKIQMDNDGNWQNKNIFTPYPFEHEEVLKLKNGHTVFLRPIRAEDATLLVKHVANLSEYSREMRFASKSKNLPPTTLLHLSNPDYQREFALLVHDDELCPLAIASYTADADLQSCEFGISLLDKMQGQGLGMMIMQRLITRARQQGFCSMHAEILAQNYFMQKLALKLGFTISKYDDDATMLSANLPL